MHLINNEAKEKATYTHLDIGFQSLQSVSPVKLGRYANQHPETTR